MATYYRLRYGVEFKSHWRRLQILTKSILLIFFFDML